MLHEASGASPSELQAAILKSLLTGADKPAEAGIDLVVPAKMMVPGLQHVLGEDRIITVVSQSTMTIAQYWQSQHETCVPFVFAMDEEGGNPSVALLPRSLITSLMTMALGGQAPITKPPNDAPLSRMEVRFATQLLSQIKTVISPILNGKIKQALIVTEDENAFVARLPETQVHTFSYSLELGEVSFNLDVAIACSAFAPLHVHNSKASQVQALKPDVAAEIGRTQINVEVVFKLGEQTLQRLQTLKTGDVIAMMSANFSEAKMRVRGHELFEGHIGKSGESYCFKVARPTRKQTGGMSQMVKTLTERGQDR